MILIDAGPLYALLNAGDDHHRSCVETLKTIKVPLLTTWAAFTEAMYLLGSDFGWHGQQQLWAMYWTRKFTVAEPTLQLMERVYRLMEKYKDLPMDLADASLVAVAEEQGINTIFTVDKADFRLYKLHGRKTFRLLPE